MFPLASAGFFDLAAIGKAELKMVRSAPRALAQNDVSAHTAVGTRGGINAGRAGPAPATGWR
jgi:hypothetical protein